jgi:3-dehydroquinate synthase
VIEILIRLGDRRYPVRVGHGLAGSLPSLLPGLKGKSLVVVSSHRIWSIHGGLVERGLRELGPLSRVLIPDGEIHKSALTLGKLYSAFLEKGLARDGVVVAFGGGVVGDVTGFAAATYMRGVALVQLPTTLLAMVDSAIGGKVGVNHPKAKNLVGAFHQPVAVIVDPSFLATLPPRQIQSGLYEVLKCGVIGDRRLFSALSNLPSDFRSWSSLEAPIAAACRLKARVVEKDERESGVRRVLNLGHTVGHALEAVTRYRRFTHGEAVGWGMLASASIARHRGMLSQTNFEAITTGVDRVGPRPGVDDIDPEAVLDAVANDKKKKDGRVSFVLPTAIGRVAIRPDVTRAEILAALKVLASWVMLPPGRLPGAASKGPSGREVDSRPRRKRSIEARR